MAYWDRFDICMAHHCLENDWNAGGWLRERPSNRRRKEATHVQLHRLGFGGHTPHTFDDLIYMGEDNAAEIYVNALVRFGLLRQVYRSDPLGEWIQAHRPELSENLDG